MMDVTLRVVTDGGEEKVEASVFQPEEQAVQVLGKYSGPRPMLRVSAVV